jgi:hypothetical protein
MTGKIVLPMIKKAKRRKNARPTWSKEQEAAYKAAITDLEQLGYEVRREELKRGHGWKAMSGSCRSAGQRIIFVDNRLTPAEQVAFLTFKLEEAKESQQEPEKAVA